MNKKRERERNHIKPALLREVRVTISLTAAQTNLIFSVSVAHVKCG